MIQEALEILVDNLTNERLDNIVQQDKEYTEIRERVHKSLIELESIATDKKAINKYDAVVHEESALYVRLAYKQALKDFVQLLLSLI